MQFGLVIIAIISLAFLSSAGGLAPEQFPAAKDDDAAVTKRVAGVSSNQERLPARASTDRPAPATTIEEVITDYRTPVITSYAPRNIENNNALVRADLNMYDHKGGTVFVAYGYNQNQVTELAKSDQALDRNFNNRDDRARVMFLDLNPRGQESYEKRISRLVPDADYFYQVCLEYTDLASVQSRVCGLVESFSTNPESSINNRFQVPRISADRALSVTDGEASIEVSLRMNDGVDGIPFIVYGIFKELVGEIDEKYTTYSSIREFDEDLQKSRLGVRRLGQSEYQVELDDLDEDTKYY